MSTFKKVSNYIYRLEVPFFTVYTSVFLVVTKDGMALVDSATTAEDVDEWIVPALAELGYAVKDSKTGYELTKM